MGIFRYFPYSNFHDMNMDWVIKEVKRLSEEWAETHTEWEGFKEWIENYFNTLDLTQEVQDVIDLMISSGQFVTLLATASQPEIDAWLEANITNPSSPPLDSSFLLDNAAARSSAVGLVTSANQNLLVMKDHTKEETNITAVQDAEAGTVTFTGTALVTQSFFIYNSEDDTTPFSFTAQAGVTYTLSGCPMGGGANTFDLDLRTSLGGVIKYADYGYGVTFTPETNEVLYPHIRIIQNNGNGVVFKPQIEIGTVPSMFVPESNKSAKDTLCRGFLGNIDKHVDTVLSNGNIVNRMIDTAMTYINHNSDLTYGQETALHWYVGGTDQTSEVLYGDDQPDPSEITEIDCSTFALLVLAGVPYELSRYAVDTNIIGAMDYHYDPYNGNDTARAAHTGELTLTYKLAEYLHDNNIGFIVDETNIGNIKPGDLLFFSAIGHDPTAFLGIDHCEILVDTLTNLPEDYNHPDLITLNCSGGRANPVEINNRYHTFYDGTLPSNRKLVYAASLANFNVETRNRTIYTNPHSDRVYLMPINSPAFKPITVNFKGVINIVNNHFTFYINGTPKQVTMDIPLEAVGKTFDYRITYAPDQPVDTLSIIASASDSIITDVYITVGVAR